MPVFNVDPNAKESRTMTMPFGGLPEGVQRTWKPSKDGESTTLTMPYGVGHPTVNNLSVKELAIKTTQEDLPTVDQNSEQFKKYAKNIEEQMLNSIESTKGL